MVQFCFLVLDAEANFFSSLPAGHKRGSETVFSVLMHPFDLTSRTGGTGSSCHRSKGLGCPLCYLLFLSHWNAMKTQWWYL